MADWSTPVLASTYVAVLDALKNRDIDAAVGFSPTYSTATNLPTGTIRWNPTNGYWEVRDGAGAWGALATIYNVNVDKLDGQDGSYYLAWANLTGVPSTFTPSVHTHDDRYFTETESDARFANKIVTSGNTIKLQTVGNVDLSTITVPYATNAGTVGGFSVGQNLLTTSSPTFAGLTLGATAITVTAAEINYLDGVTSAVQTQLNGKQATITGGATSIVSANLTASRALASDASGKVTVSAATATELGYLSGVTSAIQTQLNAKAPTAGPTFTGTVTLPTLRLTTTNDLSLASTAHAFQIGATATENLVIDTNEIQVRNNGAASPLVLNAEGGNITLGAAGAVVTVPGTLNPTYLNIPALSVGTAELNTGAVTTSKMVDNAVTTSKIANNAVSAEKLNWNTGSQAISTGSGGGGATINLPSTVIHVYCPSIAVQLTHTGSIGAPSVFWYTSGATSTAIYWTYLT